MICFPFLRQFCAPDVFFPGAPACTWNCMAPFSSFSPSIWLPWRFISLSPCLHLKLYGTPLVLLSVNLAPLTFSSLEPSLELETAWRPSRPFLRQFGAPDVFFPGAPACTWNYMAPLSPFSPSIMHPWHFLPWSPCLHLKLHGTPLVLFFFSSIWHPWRFLPWSPCLHLKLYGTPLALFSVNLAPLTFSSLEPLLALETAWHPSRPFFFLVNLAPLTFSSLEPLLALETTWHPFRPFLRQFGAPDIFFSGAPACTWNCVWRPSRPFLPQFGAPDVFFPGAPACTWNCMVPLSSYWFNLLSFFFLSCSLSSLFSFLFPSFPLFPFFSLLSFFLSLSFFSFLAPLWWHRGAQAPKAPPRYAPGDCNVYAHSSLWMRPTRPDRYNAKMVYRLK